MTDQTKPMDAERRTIYAPRTEGDAVRHLMYHDEEGVRVVTQHPDLGMRNFATDELFALDEFLHEHVPANHPDRALLRACRKVCDANDERWLGAEFWFADKIGQFDGEGESDGR